MKKTLKETADKVGISLLRLLNCKPVVKVVSYKKVKYLCVFDGENWLMPQKLIKDLYEKTRTKGTLITEVMESYFAHREATFNTTTGAELRKNKGVKLSHHEVVSPSNNSIFVPVNEMIKFVNTFLVTETHNKELIEDFTTMLVQINETVEPEITPRELVLARSEDENADYKIVKIRELEERVTQLTNENKKLRYELTNSPQVKKTIRQVVEEKFTHFDFETERNLLGITHTRLQDIMPRFIDDVADNIGYHAASIKDKSGYTTETMRFCNEGFITEKLSNYDLPRMLLKTFNQFMVDKLKSGSTGE